MARAASKRPYGGARSRHMRRVESRIALVTLPKTLIEQVAESARSVRLDEAEATLVDWWSSVDHGELAASEADVRALIEQHFLPKRRRRILESLTAQLASRSVLSYVAAPAESEVADVPAADQPVSTSTADGAARARVGQDASSLVVGISAGILAEVSELNRTANPRAAEELFRTWLSEAPEVDLTELESEVRAVLNRFLRKRHNALTAAYDQRLARIRAASHVRSPSVVSSDVSAAVPAPAA